MTSFLVPEIFKFTYYAYLVTDDVISCASSLVWHKIEDISAWIGLGFLWINFLDFNASWFPLSCVSFNWGLWRFAYFSCARRDLWTVTCKRNLPSYLTVFPVKFTTFHCAIVARIDLLLICDIGCWFKLPQIQTVSTCNSVVMIKYMYTVNGHIKFFPRERCCETLPYEKKRKQ